MMAGLFLVMAVALAFIYFGMRKVGMSVLIVGMALACLMLWHHMTDVLRINW